MYNNNYNNNNQYNQAPPQQDNNQYWPKISGFKIGPSKSGKGNVITFTMNSTFKSKEPPMMFADFMAAVQAAFQASGGQGVRFVIPFHQGMANGRTFTSASIQVFPNNPNQQFNGGGGGRRSYPTQQAQGYGQPQHNYGQPVQQPVQQRPVAPPPQQYPQQQGYAPQGTQQFGTSAPTTQAATPQGGNGQPVQNGAYPSEEPIPF